MNQHLVFFLEEPSIREMLQAVLPKLNLQGITIRYMVFQGKQELEKELTRKIKGYQTPNHRYQKISGSRAIGPHLDLHNTRSPSFKNLITGIKRLLATPCPGA
jgi:hypothetical protein